ncbi:YciI family protein [Mesorhizobium sp. PL10]
MRYMILIHRTPDFWTKLRKDERAELRSAYIAYEDAVKKAGVLVAADQLQPAMAAKVVGETAVLDGPYADTDSKEELGGYFLIDVPGEADAIAWARRCPGAHYGRDGRGVEVRPVIQQ